MHTTNELLDALAAKHGGASNYRLGKLLNTASASTVQNWRIGRSSLSLDYAIKVAKLLDWPPEYVIACVEAERAGKDDRLEQTGEIIATWQRIAERFKPAAMLALCVLAGLTGADISSAASPVPSNTCAWHSIHYAQFDGRRRRRRKSKKRDPNHPPRFCTWLPILLNPLYA